MLHPLGRQPFKHKKNIQKDSSFTLTLEDIRVGGGSIWLHPSSISLALNFCSLTDYQKL